MTPMCAYTLIGKAAYRKGINGTARTVNHATHPPGMVVARLVVHQRSTSDIADMEPTTRPDKVETDFVLMQLKPEE